MNDCQPLIGYTAEFGGKIKRTTNGGSLWTTQYSSSDNLKSIYFTDANTGYVVGENGTILQTINSGVTWVKQSSGTTNNLESVYFFDKNSGYAVGGGTILKTTNSGTTWDLQTIQSYLYSVYFFNSNIGYIVGTYGTILKYTGSEIEVGPAGTIAGSARVSSGASNITYSVPPITNATSYIWTLPTGATGTSTTNSITVSYSDAAVSGDIKVKGHNEYDDGPESTLAIVVAPTGIEPAKLNNSIRVYPNPVTNELIIEFEGNTNKIDFEVINSIGQVVFTGILLERTVVQTVYFTPGVYLVKLKSGKTFEFKKVIKK